MSIKNTLGKPNTVTDPNGYPEDTSNSNTGTAKKPQAFIPMTPELGQEIVVQTTGNPPIQSDKKPVFVPTDTTGIIGVIGGTGGTTNGTTNGGTTESGTGNGGGTPPSKNLSEGNLYYDALLGQQDKPNFVKSEDSSAGSDAAKGTMYSWDKQGLDAAQNQYNQDALKAKQDALANRQVQEQNALQYQQQADMMKYANNQDAEKVGWTGGYVLDQNRQMDYLKASIQAQMYGAMELQKYGYDSALAAARLSYDINQKEFAHKYYQDAINVALSEAQITGTYFSAETRDMMSQLNAANQELKLTGEDGKPLTLEQINEKIKEGGISLTPEQQRALEVRRNIESWYSANKVSTVGIQTLAAWELEQTMAQNWSDNQWQMYQAALSTAETKDKEDVNTFIMYDEKGNPIYDGTSVSLGNFRNMTAKEIIEYYNKTSQTGKQQVLGHVDNSFGQIISSYLETVKKTGSDGNVSYDINPTKLEELLRANPKVEDLKEILKDYSYDMSAGDSLVEIDIDSKGQLSIDIKGGKTQGSIADTQDKVNTNETLTPEEKQEVGNIISDVNNKVFDSKELTVNQSGDKFSNNTGDRGEGNNFSVLHNGEIIRVQNGAQVKYGSTLDNVLESYSQKQGTLAVVDGVLYVRDNTCWYVVEGRPGNSEDWNKLQQAYNLNYSSAPESEYYTTNKQRERPTKQNAPTATDSSGNTITKWNSTSSSKPQQFWHAGIGDNYTVGYNNSEYTITIVWEDMGTSRGDNEKLMNNYTMPQIKETAKDLHNKYKEPTNGDIVYYQGNYWFYNQKENVWGLIGTGDSQDSKAKDGDKLINALNGK